MGFCFVGRFAEVEVPKDAVGVCGDWDKWFAWNKDGKLFGSALQPWMNEMSVWRASCGERIVALVESCRTAVWIQTWDGEPKHACVEGIVKDVCCGRDHVLVLLENGNLFAFGSCEFRQCGLSARAESLVLVLRNVKAIACGALHSVCLLEEDGSALISGWTRYGQGGGGFAEEGHTASFCSVDCDDNLGFVGVACGLFHSLLLRANGEIVGLGYNCNGQVDLDELKDCVSVAAGTRHSVALTREGDVIFKGFRAPHEVLHACKTITAFGWTTVVGRDE